MNTRKTGEKYEEIACEYLRKAGMQVISKNWRTRFGEIDIICTDSEATVFVEVKYRKNKDYGGACFAISEAKKKNIRRVAQCYIKQNRLSANASYRFDAILIDGNEISHIKNAW